MTLFFPPETLDLEYLNIVLYLISFIVAGLLVYGAIKVSWAPRGVLSVLCVGVFHQTSQTVPLFNSAPNKRFAYPIEPTLGQKLALRY